MLPIKKIILSLIIFHHNSSLCLLNQASQHIMCSHYPAHPIMEWSLSNIPVVSSISSPKYVNNKNLPSTLPHLSPTQAMKTPSNNLPENLPSTDSSYKTITSSYFRPWDNSLYHMVVQSKKSLLKLKALITSHHSIPLDPSYSLEPTTYHQASI